MGRETKSLEMVPLRTTSATSQTKTEGLPSNAEDNSRKTEQVQNNDDEPKPSDDMPKSIEGSPKSSDDTAKSTNDKPNNFKTSLDIGNKIPAEGSQKERSESYSDREPTTIDSQV